MNNKLLWVALAAALAPAIAHAQLPSVTVTSAAYQPLVGATTIAWVDGDDEGQLLPLGFNFTFLGQTYTHVMVSSNGALMLGGPTLTTCATGCTSNPNIPGSTFPNGPFIAGFWDDLDVGAGGVVRYIRTANSFTVEYSAVARYLAMGHAVTFQMQLDSSGTFSIHHGSITGTSLWSASIGFQGAIAAQGLSLEMCGANCTTLTPDRLYLIGAPTIADLTVSTVSLSNLTVLGDGNLNMTVDAVLQNRGRTAASNFTWRAALSRDRFLDLNATDGGADVIIGTGGTVSIGAFDGGPASVSVSTSAATTTPPTTGEYYVLVEVDPTFQVNESDETNNVGSIMTPISQGDDVAALSITGPTTASPGNQEQLSISFVNRNLQPVNALAFRLLLSSDLTVSANDIVLASGTRTLNAAQTLNEVVPVTIPFSVAAGTFNFLLELDPANVLVESNELNNVIGSSPLTIARGDLEAVRTTIVNIATGAPTSTARFGQVMRAVVRVRNAGATSLSNFRVGALLSRDTNFSLLTDTYLCDQPVVSLAPGISTDVTLDCTLPLVDGNNVPFSQGDFYVLGLVDAYGAIGESNEANNGASVTVAISAPGPDLTFTGINAPALAGPGEVFAFGRTLRNVGDAPAGAASYRCFASPDAQLTASDVPLTIGATALIERSFTLAVGASDQGTDWLNLPSSLSPGTWFIGCIADFGAAVAEADEGNNVGLVSVTVGTSGLAVATAQLPDAVVGRAYSYQLVATGALAPTWALAPGESVPPGLSLSSAGELSGTPAVAGLTSFVVRITDSMREATARLTLRVVDAVPSLEITTTVAPPVLADPSVVYALRLAATGGTAPYAWSVSSGTLPAGLSCANDGLVSGSPMMSAVDGVTRVVFEVSDAMGTRARRELVFRVVAPGALVVNTTQPPVGLVGRVYSHQLTANGTATVTWTVASGALPDGVSLVSTTSGAELTGTPSREGSFSFSISAEDDVGRRDTVWLDVQIRAAALVISSTDLVAFLRPGAAVSAHFGAVLAVEPQFSIASGELPPGVSLAADGTLSGTMPNEAGKTWAFVVEARDATGARGVGAFSLATEATASGCSAAPGLAPLALLAFMLAAVRRRRLEGIAGGLVALAVVCSPLVARAQYVVQGPTPTTYQPLTAGTVVNANNSISLPFAMPFFDTTLTSVIVSQYGYLTTGYAASSNNLGIPHNNTSAFLPQLFIAPWWDSLTPPLSYRMQVSGTAPRRTVTFEWNGAGANITTNRISFQVQLSEANGNIRFLYSTALPGVVSASVGLQRQPAVGLAALPCATTGACTSAAYPAGMAIEFRTPANLVAGPLSGPDTGYPGTTLPIVARVSNTGGIDLPSVVVRFIMSSDAVLDGADVVLGDATVALAGGQALDVRSTFAVPSMTPQGPRFVFVQLDPGAQIAEPNEGDNAAGPMPISIAAPIADLEAVSVTAPPTAAAGATVQVSVDVRNAGSLAAPTSSFTWRLSSNAAITPSDATLGAARPLMALAAGASATVPDMVTIPSSVQSGQYWLGVCLNEGTTVPEATLVNDCVASGVINVSGVPLRVSTTQLPSPALQLPYGFRLRHEGGDGTAVWSVISGTLPPGLALSAAGDLQGVPVQEGAFRFEVQVTSGGAMANATFVVVVESGRALAILDQVLAPATIGRAYEVDLLASGGRPPYSWSITGGALAPGLTLTAQGVLVGRASMTGDFTATATVTDTAGTVVNKDLTLTVEGIVPLQLMGELLGARLAEPYSQTLSVLGGRTPHTLRWVGLQELPSGPTDAPGPVIGDGVTALGTELGLRLDAATLSGAPNRAGQFKLSFLVTDADGATARLERVLTVSADPLEITTTTLPDAVVGEDFSARLESTATAEFSLACTRAAPDFVCQPPAASARLPPGLLLSSVGTISGKPTATGAAAAERYTFLVKAIDPNGRQALRALAITVSPPKKTGCSSVPSLSLMGLAVFFFLRRRRS